MKEWKCRKGQQKRGQSEKGGKSKGIFTSGPIEVERFETFVAKLGSKSFKEAKMRGKQSNLCCWEG